MAYVSRLGKMDKDRHYIHFHNSKHAGCATYKVLTGNYYYILGYQNILPLIATYIEVLVYEVAENLTKVESFSWFQFLVQIFVCYEIGNAIK